MKTMIITIAAVLGLTVLVLGGESAWSYMRGGREIVNETVSQNSPMRLEFSRVQALLTSESDRIFQYEDKIADIQGRLEATLQTVDRLTRQRRNETSLLEKIKTLLDQKKREYEIGGRTYTLAEVNSDALKRLESVRSIDEQVALQNSLLEDLRQAVKAGSANLTLAQKKQEELRGKLNHLQARNSNADIKAEISRLTGCLDGTSLSASSELEKAFRNYETRVAQKERRANRRSPLTHLGGAPMIDYSSSVMTQDAAIQIEQLLRPSQPEKSGPEEDAPIEILTEQTPAVSAVQEDEEGVEAGSGT